MPVLEARSLEARARCYDRYYRRYYNCNNAWGSWARWLVLGLILAAAIVIFMLFACISARRRRKMGHQPFRGTGWAVGHTPAGHNAPTYNNNAQPYYANTQPAYNNSNNPAPPPAYNSAGANQSYYGQQNGTELQQPQQAYGGYRSGETAFEPPKGPPPGR